MFQKLIKLKVGEKLAKNIFFWRKVGEKMLTFRLETVILFLVIKMKPRIYKNKDGKIVSFTFRAYVGTDEFGNKKLLSQTWKPDGSYTERQLLKEANRRQILFEEKVKEHIANNSFGLTVDIHTPFKRFAEYWIEEYSKPKNRIKTTTSYLTMLVRINEYIGNIELNKITPLMINKFLNDLSKPGAKKTSKNITPLSTKTIKNYYILLSSIFKTAIKWQILKSEDNPMNGVFTPKVQRKPVKALSKNETKTLLKTINEFAPLKYQIFIHLAVITGMRRGELCGLTWDNVDWDNNSIKIEKSVLYDKSNGGVFVDNTKTESSVRIVKIPEYITNLLKEYKRKQDYNKSLIGSHWNKDGFIFVQDNGSPMHPNTPYTWFKRFQNSHNLPQCSIHALRHTTATLLILNGVDIKSVSGRLGHSNSATTVDTYGYYLREADEVVTQTLDNIINKKGE